MKKVSSPQNTLKIRNLISISGNEENLIISSLIKVLTRLFIPSKYHMVAKRSKRGSNMIYCVNIRTSFSQHQSLDARIKSENKECFVCECNIFFI